MYVVLRLFIARVIARWDGKDSPQISFIKFAVFDLMTQAFWFLRPPIDTYLDQITLDLLPFISSCDVEPLNDSEACLFLYIT